MDVLNPTNEEYPNGDSPLEAGTRQRLSGSLLNKGTGDDLGATAGLPSTGTLGQAGTGTVFQRPARGGCV